MELLDADFPRKKRKPASIWKTGVFWGGFGAVVILLSKLGLFSPIIVPYMLPLLLFGWIAQIYIALFGSRKEHFARIWTVSLIVYVPILAVEFASNWQMDNAFQFFEFIGYLIGQSVFGAVFAAIFWVLPGKISYFRHQIDE